MTSDSTKATNHSSPVFSQSILDALSAHIAVLNSDGEIIAVNKAWRQFSENNHGTAISCGIGTNYLEVCDTATGAWSEEAPVVARGIREVMSGKSTDFTLEYPCHSPSEKRWFEIRVTRFGDETSTMSLIIAHESITERKKHEKELERTNRLYASLHHVNRAVANLSSQDDIFRKVCQILVEKGSFSLAWIGCHDEKSHRIVPIASWGIGKEYLQEIKVYADDRVEGRGPVGKTFREGRPYICNDFYNDPGTLPWQAVARERGINAVAVFPIRALGQVHGTLAVYATETDFFQDKEVELLEEVSSTVSFALDSLEAVKQREQYETELHRMHEELELRVKQRTTELEQANASLQREVVERQAAEAKVLMRMSQQKALAAIGQQALINVDLDSIMQNITDYVTSTMGVEVSSLLELLPGGENFCFRASSGWKADVSQYQLPNDANSHAGCALLSETPLIVDDFSKETRFKPSPHLLEEGIVSGATVTVGGGGKPFGILGAYTVNSRHFTPDDIYSLQNMANVLSTALEQRRITNEITQLNDHLQEVNEKLNTRNGQLQMTMDALEETVQLLKQAKAEADEAKESAENANRTKNEFLSRMSHELRTPLNAILGFGQILEQQDLTELQIESVKYIIKGGRHLLNLINDVLDISRIEAGRFDLSIEPINLDDIIGEACALIRPLATEHNIQLYQESSMLADCHVMADRRQLKQVFINLFSNAIKYNNPGGKVTVSWTTTEEGKIRISVIDTGHGIAAEDISKIFTPFERLDADTTGVEGTGLGLPLSQHLLTVMGSDLFVKSTLGKGSNFYFDLPSASAPENELVNSSKSIYDLGARTLPEKKYTILLIEDNPSNLRLIEMILSSRPEVTLYSAIQGSMGLELARQHLPNLILLDLHLPDMSGQQVFNQLKGSEITRDIPIMVVSADATPSRIERVMKGGATAYLTKPLNVVDFLKAVDETLQSKKTASPKMHTEEGKS